MVDFAFLMKSTTCAVSNWLFIELSFGSSAMHELLWAMCSAPTRRIGAYSNEVVWQPHCACSYRRN